MRTMEWRTVDKSNWGRGEWDHEPDKKQWTDEKTGLPCLIVRGPSGALCGYVGVSKGHPAFGVDYDSVRIGEECPDVHGGLTFSAHCTPTDDPAKHICHMPDEGEDDNVWWLGFDCAHSGDIMPTHDRAYRYLSWEATYKSIAYVEGHCRALAEQLKSIAP